MDSIDIKNILGSSVRELRENKGWTQEQLSEFLGVQVNTVNRIENGISFVSSETFAKLCNVFEVNPTVLLSARPTHILKEHIEYVQEINQLLQTFSIEKIKNAHNILSVLNK
ncbi:helix-turn-helix transcriptional regulator [bacterium]|nr:helix-turn-helix transcriptional regulator [bacterium]